MTTFTDDFNRADSTDLGGGWVEVSGEWAIASNQLSPGAAGGTVILRVASAMATNDNYAQVVIAATAAVSQGVWCRGNSNITSGYLWRNNGASWDMFSVVGGSFTMIGTYAAAAAPGDVARVQAVGTTVKGLVNGVERVSVADTGVSTGTSVGIRSESSASMRYDTFAAGDIVTTVTGTGAAAFGALAAVASGVRKVSATAVAGGFGALAATAVGTRKVGGTAAFSGGALAGGAAGVRMVSGSGAGQFGALQGAAVVASHVTGTATGELSGLTASAQGSVPAAASTGPGSWNTLFSIVTEAVAYAREERTQPPIACPYDGEPLRAAPGGGLFCPLGNYEYPKMRRII